MCIISGIIFPIVDLGANNQVSGGSILEMVVAFVIGAIFIYSDKKKNEEVEENDIKIAKMNEELERMKTELKNL